MYGSFFCNASRLIKALTEHSPNTRKSSVHKIAVSNVLFIIHDWDLATKRYYELDWTSKVIKLHGQITCALVQPII